MRISEINLKIILDSRGEETLEAAMHSSFFSAKASVPSGKSRGKHEAFVTNPKEAVKKLKKAENKILNRDFENQTEFDDFLIHLDATENKKNLGGNLILALSLAFARLKAKEERIELFRYIQKNAGGDSIGKLPTPIFNVINGGVHATHPESRLDFQEFQVIPQTIDFGIGFAMGREFYLKLKQALEKKFGKEDVFLGDEAGFSAPFKNNEEALSILYEIIFKYRYPLKIGLDAAASQFFRRGFYLFEGKKRSVEELKDLYSVLIRRYDVVSLEDPFCEEDFDSFASLNEELRGLSAPGREEKLIITDDLTTTSVKRLKKAIDKKSGNAILIKPNQIGTLTETLEVAETASRNDWETVVSHRSGETMDDFIADLSVGIGSWGIKAGPPASGERLVKYERIFEISHKIF